MAGRDPTCLAARHLRLTLSALLARMLLCTPLQKDATLDELERLTEGLVAQARAAQGPALDLAVRVSEARRAQAVLTRRLMATVSELSLYQALALKAGADRAALAGELAAARAALAAGRPPTAGAEQASAGRWVGWSTGAIGQPVGREASRGMRSPAASLPHPPTHAGV